MRPEPINKLTANTRTEIKQNTKPEKQIQTLKLSIQDNCLHGVNSIRNYMYCTQEMQPCISTSKRTALDNFTA